MTTQLVERRHGRECDACSSEHNSKANVLPNNSMRLTRRAPQKRAHRHSFETCPLDISR